MALRGTGGTWEVLWGLGAPGGGGDLRGLRAPGGLGAPGWDLWGLGASAGDTCRDWEHVGGNVCGEWGQGKVHGGRQGEISVHKL